MLIVFLGDCINKQKLFLQEELNKACTENAELQAEKLALMEKTSCLYEKSCTLLFCKLYLHKQLGVLSEKEKKMFAGELASIKDLERLKHEVSEGVESLNAIKVSELIVNPFDNLFNLLSLLVLASVVDIP